MKEQDKKLINITRKQWIWLIICILIMLKLMIFNSYDRMIYQVFTAQDTEMIQTKTIWGDYFKDVFSTENNSSNFLMGATTYETLYDNNNQVITRGALLEGYISEEHATCFKRSLKYPKGRWILPIINDGTTRTYLLFENSILYYDPNVDRFVNIYPDLMEEKDVLRPLIQESLEKLLEEETYYLPTNKELKEEIQEALDLVK